MQHRDKNKYKQFPGQDNIIIGSGELIAVVTTRGDGWITPANDVIYNREDAEKYAKRLDDLIQFNRQRVAVSKVRY